MRISVVTISFNQAPYLNAAIESVLGQNFEGLEYIVVDAGSTDGSRGIIRRYGNRISKTIFESDTGPADGLNKGFSHATGDIFFYLNADDVVLPGAFRTIASYFDKRPEIDVIYGHGLQLDAEGCPVRRLYSTRWGLRAYGFGECNVVQQATYFRSAAFKAIGGFNENNRTCWDGELLVDMALARGSFLRVSEYLGGFRIHQGSISGGGQLEAEYARDSTRLAEKALGRAAGRSDAFWRGLYRGVRILCHPVVMANKLMSRSIRNE
ncbi:MAG: glycosyltransferase [Gammaproteobacteria bacterium]|nr:glycosyltransferase [Gammaproteobacteria bacterium]